MTNFSKGFFYSLVIHRIQELKMTDDQFLTDLQADDDLGAVIRAHLYIEHFTDQILDLVVPKPKLLKPLRLDFDGKVNLIVALGVDPDIKKPLSALGVMRNKFAHRPNYKLDKSETKNLYESLGASDKELLHSCYNTIRKTHPEMSDAPVFNKLNPKEQFVLVAIAIRGLVVSTLNELKQQNV